MQSQVTTTAHQDPRLSSEPIRANSTLDERVHDFLAQQRIAVTGVSAQRELTGNIIYRKLKAAGYQVFAVNPGTPIFDTGGEVR